MKFRSFITWLCVFTLLWAGYSFTFPKKRKFLDHFTTIKADSLYVTSGENEDVYKDPSAPLSVKGFPIDSMYMNVFESEEAVEIREFVPIGTDTGPMAYSKIKLDLGYYLLIIRAGGEYYHSRYHACLYNAGSKKVTYTFPVADILGDAGYYYVRSSKFLKEDKEWNIYTHEIFFEPLDVDWESLDTIQVKEVDIVTTIEPRDEHFFFTEKSKKEKTYIQK